MSVIVAMKHNGTVYMGADTQCSCGDEKKNSLIESERKIIKLDNGLLLGGTGRADVLMRLFYSKGIFTVPEEGLTKKHIVTEIVPKLFKYLDERNLICEPDEDDDDEKCHMRCSLMLVHKDKIFYLNGYFGVWENARFCIIGSGTSYAFPYLDSYDGKGDVNDVLLAAMRGCSKHDSSVSAPYILIDSRNQTYSVREV